MTGYITEEHAVRIFSDNERGMTLAETIVALAIFGIVAAILVTGLATSSKAVMVSQERVAADSLAKAEIEYIKSCSYSNAPWSYELPSNPPAWDPTRVIPDGYDGYDIASNGACLPGHDPDDGIQRISVTVNHNGDIVLTLVDYKVDR